MATPSSACAPSRAGHAWRSAARRARAVRRGAGGVDAGSAAIIAALSMQCGRDTNPRSRRRVDIRSPRPPRCPRGNASCRRYNRRTFRHYAHRSLPRPSLPGSHSLLRIPSPAVHGRRTAAFAGLFRPSSWRRCWSGRCSSRRPRRASRLRRRRRHPPSRGRRSDSCCRAAARAGSRTSACSRCCTRCACRSTTSPPRRWARSSVASTRAAWRPTRCSGNWAP